MMKVVLTMLSLFVWCVMFVSITSASDEAFTIKFGLMEKDRTGTYHVYSETTTIPQHLRKTGFRFGFTVEHPSGETFIGYRIVYLPGPPKHITGGLERAGKKEREWIIQSSPKTYKGSWKDSFWFDEGDPTGKWRIEIYVNNTLLRVVNFTVVPVK